MNHKVKNVMQTLDKIIEPNKNNFDKESITDILTLRYARKLKSSIPKLTWNNFKFHNLNPSESKIENLIQNNIKRSIINPKSESISVALSGGIDSSLVLALLKKTLPESKIKAFSVKFSNSVDESQEAAKIAESLDIDHETIFLENYLSELPKAISIIKEPFWDLHFYHVAKKSQKYDYLLSGDGSDELFAGYVFRYKKFLQSVTEKSTPLEKVKVYLNCHERDWIPKQEEIFSKKMNFSWNKIYSSLLPYFDNSLSLLDQVILADFNGKLLYNWSPLFTKISNFFNIKLITPILSKETIDYAFSIPNHLKYDQNTNMGKLQLRKLLSKYVDKSLIQTKKQGFSVDTINLWKSYGKNICDYYITDGNIVKDGWVNKEWIIKNIHKTDLDIRHINKFLGLLGFEIWYRLFITHEIKPNTKLN